ncbi:hypothetical protein AAFF_G00111230 [Aldrovandia affinis]|uniref:Uncharacterized protein n=1 Tax=Aldrovandia affinis TaxID=143900 RepID=A0AAD7RTI8_9TELE|nr:hypothetical protein AAFF_G00111230 [Aldrovandia affinis]
MVESDRKQVGPVIQSPWFADSPEPERLEMKCRRTLLAERAQRPSLRKGHLRAGRGRSLAPPQDQPRPVDFHCQFTPCP